MLWSERNQGSELCSQGGEKCVLMLDGLRTALPGTLPCAPAGTWPSILCDAGARGKAALPLSYARPPAGAKAAKPGHYLCPEYS